MANDKDTQDIRRDKCGESHEYRIGTDGKKEGVTTCAKVIEDQGGGKIEFMCCFCGKSIKDKTIVNVGIWVEDGTEILTETEQAYWSHRDCVINAMDESSANELRFREGENE